MSAPTTLTRVDAVRLALDSHQQAKGEDISENDERVIDLLADIRHFCAAHDFDFSALDRMAAMHFEEEPDRPEAAP